MRTKLPTLHRVAILGIAALAIRPILFVHGALIRFLVVACDIQGSCAYVALGSGGLSVLIVALAEASLVYGLRQSAVRGAFMEWRAAGRMAFYIAVMMLILLQFAEVSVRPLSGNGDIRTKLLCAYAVRGWPKERPLVATDHIRVSLIRREGECRPYEVFTLDDFDGYVVEKAGCWYQMVFWLDSVSKKRLDLCLKLNDYTGYAVEVDGGVDGMFEMDELTMPDRIVVFKSLDEERAVNFISW